MGYRYFMNNPVGTRVGDCAVRAISKALNISWEDAYAKLVVAGYQMADMPSSNNVIALLLRTKTNLIYILKLLVFHS